MNFKYVLQQLGLLHIVLGLLLLLVAAWSLMEWYFFGDVKEAHAGAALAAAGGFGIVLGAVPRFLTRHVSPTMGRREAFLLVAMSWILGAALSAFPFFIWAHLTDLDIQARQSFMSPVNCYFEAMSGLTTTGSTILTHIDDIPRSLLLWRSTTHWLGGLGIVVLFVAVLPTLGAGGKKLFQVESPGPQPEGVRPQIAQTARVLWMIYLGMTVAETIALKLAGMSWFDAVCHTFATLATGGFSTHDASVAYYQSPVIETIIIVFMLMAGINFALYYQAIRGRLKSVFRDRELRLYLTIIVAASAIIAFFLVGKPLTSLDGESHTATLGSAIRYSVFQVVSVITTTGYCTADFNYWGFFPKVLLLTLMFVGASAGSTGGGIKVVRILMMFRILMLEIERVFRPNVIRPLKLGRTPIGTDLRLGTLAYILGILLIFFVGTLCLMAFESNNSILLANNSRIDFITAASASAATLNNIGPGFNLVGATENYAWFSDASKITMTILMAIGRLEIYAILVLFVPRFWRGN